MTVGIRANILSLESTTDTNPNGAGAIFDLSAGRTSAPRGVASTTDALARPIFSVSSIALRFGSKWRVTRMKAHSEAGRAFFSVSAAWLTRRDIGSNPNLGRVGIQLAHSQPPARLNGGASGPLSRSMI